MFELTVKSSFAAAHRLRDYEGKCEHLHGHNWVVEITVESSVLNSIGLALDFKDLKEALESVLTKLDHDNLNDINPFINLNPSSENIAHWIFGSLKETISDMPVTLSRVSVWENANCCATYRE
ncbi:6-carboxytetrahydropterin synthase QueD [bacterium]|nr:6-carboxytetrahydropterin synthase QueD [bacterium]